MYIMAIHFPTVVEMSEFGLKCWSGMFYQLYSYKATLYYPQAAAHAFTTHYC